ncbi:MAG: hypothetical protein RLZZ381_2825, partial [Cyanobacteriota bacterium]
KAEISPERSPAINNQLNNPEMPKYSIEILQVKAILDLKKCSRQTS